MGAHYAEPMDRTARLDHALVRLMGGESGASETNASADAFAIAVQSLGRVSTGQLDTGRFAEAARLAGVALECARDPDALALARAVAGLAIASWPDAVADPALRDPVIGGDPLLAAREDMTELSTEFGEVIRSLLAEACLACAQVALAAEFLALDEAPPETLFGRRHPYLTFMRMLRVRVAAFAGNVSAAEALLDAAIAGASTERESVFALAGSALVLGNADRRKDVRLLVDRVLSSPVDPVGAVATGCYVLAAYGAVALGDIDTAARLVLIAGGDPDLGRLRIVDRALGLEMLVAAAAAANDVDAAEAWNARVEALVEHPISASTIDRIESRIALLREDAEGALSAAQRSIDRAVQDGRGIEVAEGEILLARARLAGDLRGEGARQLAKVADSARQRGHLAVQRSASKELRRRSCVELDGVFHRKP
jgi:hypothetical protein